MGALSSMFVSMTDITNSVTIICVLFSFFAMALLFMKSALVLRAPARGMGGMDETHWNTQATPRVPRLRMTRVHIPFTFRVLDSTNSEPYNELRCAVSSRVAYSLLAFWAVPIIDLHRALWRPWPELRSMLESLTYTTENDVKIDKTSMNTPKTCEEYSLASDNTNTSENSFASDNTNTEGNSFASGNTNTERNYFTTDSTSTRGNSLASGNINAHSEVSDGYRSECSESSCVMMREGGILPFGHAHRERRRGLPHEEKAVTLRPPWPGEPGPLGEPPRQDYPLVVLLKREDGDEETDVQSSDDTVALVNVVHLRDPVCPLPTSMLGQYLKQASGQLSSLKQLYLATPGESTSVASTQFPNTYSSANVAEQLCVVCQSFPLSRALLPCRHTCICAVCFGKLDRCPMCRAPISSFFTIRGEEYIPQSTVPNHHSSRSSKAGAALWLDALNDRLTDFLGFR